jgi:hypothetical protein
MEHTKTPWKIIGGTVIMTDDKSENVIGSTLESNSRFYETRANAAFIVLACNLHDELLAALELLVSRRDDGMLTAEEWHTAKRVIAKARGIPVEDGDDFTTELYHHIDTETE